MNMEFLREVAEVFYRERGASIGRCCFVFPNRRSSLFFRKYLGEALEEPLFSPDLITINDLFSKLSGMRVSDKYSALYDLYKIYIQKSGSVESLDDFLNWGDVILNDFDDVDKYMVNARRLFVNIQDIKELDSGYDFLSEEQIDAIRSFWQSFLPAKDKDKAREFGSLWKILYPLYCDFRKVLSDKGEGYEGMLYRSVAEKIVEGDPELLLPLERYDKVVFVALNALNNCEKILLKELQKRGQADFYWDYYGEMLTDDLNRASLYMRENVKNFESEYELKYSPSGTKDKEPLRVIAVPSAIGQTKVVADIISEIAPQDAFKTAIVLPDERLLLPLLNSIPQETDKVNVTMGYPLANTNANSLLSILVSLQNRAKVREGLDLFYHRDVVAIFDHPYIKKESAGREAELKARIIKGNMIYIDSGMIRELEDERYNLIFSSVSSVAQYLRDILYNLQETLPSLEKEFIYQIITIINRLDNLALPVENKTWFRILQSITATHSIPFRGEPLSGLQIMGPLETRGLDFDNMIILSSNEGVFPSKNVANSLIPYNLRWGFSLPTYEFMDSVSAYHFYRGIFRVKRLYMLYDMRTEGLTTGEMSRYIMQMKYHYRLPIEESVVAYDMNLSTPVAREVCKSPEIMDKLYDKYIRGRYVDGQFRRDAFSASAINTYIKCPLRFYYSYVENLKEEEDVVEEIGADLFGTIFHSVMEMVYNDYRGRVVNRSDLERISADDPLLDGYLLKAFQKSGITEIVGRNKIIFRLIKRYVLGVLTHDLQYTPFTYIASEASFNEEIDLPALSEKVRIKGFIDRIDRQGSRVRIIDYKSGSAEIKQASDVAALFDFEVKSHQDALFQIYLYTLYAESVRERSSDKRLINKDDEKETALYVLKNIMKGDIDSVILGEEQLESFRELLILTLESIFNPDIAFVETNNEDNCKWCPFKKICK